MLGAIIGAVAGIGGALLSSSSSKKAANQAADAQVQASRENNALIRELYGRNEANFQPYFQSGQRANSLIDSFLYGGNFTGGGPDVQQIGPAVPSGQAGDAPYTMGVSPGALGGRAGLNTTNSLVMDIDRMSPLYDLNTGLQLPSALDYNNMQLSPQGSTFQNQQFGQPQPTGGNAMTGYQTFVNSPYYQNPLAEGFRALNHGLASGGMLNSGDAMKRALRFGQDYAHGRQGEYLGLAQGQANRGFGAASALAGVGQNMVSETGANNRSAADALSNAALLRGQATQNLWGGIGGALGGLASSYFGR